MEKLEKQLIEYLKIKVKNMSLEEIYQDLGTEYDKDDILTTIVHLEKKGKIFRNKKNEFQAWHNGLGRIFGTIKLTSKGAGLLKEENGNITFIHRDFLNGCLNGDKVIVKDLKMVKPRGKEKERQEGKVERIVERVQSRILCELINNNGVKSIKPLTENEDLKVRINKDDIKKYVDGDLLLVDLELERKDEYFPGTILKRVCHKDDPNSELITIAATHGFDYEFPDEVKEEVKNIPKDIKNEDLSNRVDLRNKLIFTIDGEDTKDIDDAISLEILPNGNYKLGVHIADVSHYVKPGTAIFREALKRGTSLYMLSSVIPMLPRELSNGICSLNPNEERLAKSCEMEIDPSGNIISSKIFDSVIKSNKKMSYTAVNKIIESNEIPEGYEDYAELLKEMNNLSKRMSAKRKNAGAVEFDKPEMKIITDIKGRIKEIKVLKQRSAELLIENFMLAANETVATTVAKRKLPFIYRVHDLPNKDKLSEIADNICSNNNEIKKPSAPFSSSKVIQRFLSILSKYQEYPAYSNMILRCMSKAEYSNNNIGHFGLAMQNYTHFTSPIRRFPDLIVHHLLSLYDNKDLSDINMRELNETIGEIAFQSSERERAAQRAEYDANDMKTAEFMADHIGEEYNGTIVDITDKGMSIILDNLIEGFVANRDIEPKGLYKLYKSKRMLISEQESYKLGDKVSVKVKSANKKTKKINFIALGHEKTKNEQEIKEKAKTKTLSSRQN